MNEACGLVCRKRSCARCSTGLERRNAPGVHIPGAEAWIAEGRRRRGTPYTVPPCAAGNPSRVLTVADLNFTRPHAQVSHPAATSSAQTANAIARINFVDVDGDLAGGTGFLFNSSQGLALGTTAHALVGSRVIPADPSMWRSSGFKALSPDGSVEVPLPLERARTVPRSDDTSLLGRVD